MTAHTLHDLPASCSETFTKVKIEPDFFDASRLQVIFFEPDGWGGHVRSYGCCLHKNNGRWTFPLSGKRKAIRDFFFNSMSRETFRELQSYVTGRAQALYP